MIQLCKFERDANGICRCVNCNATNPYCEAKRECDKQEIPSPPPLTQRVVNFVAAAAQHAIAGNPVVSEKVLQERLKICQACELFKRNQNEIGGVCTHSSCGCNIQDNLNYLNKIAWADQQCPIGKWGKSENGV